MARDGQGWVSGLYMGASRPMCYFSKLPLILCLPRMTGGIPPRRGRASLAEGSNVT